MERTRKRAAILTLAAIALVFAVSAKAGEVGEGTKARAGGRTGQQIIVVNPGDSVRYLLRGDASGNLLVSEAFKPENTPRTWSDIIPTDSLRAAGDSSAVIDLMGARHLILCIKGCPKGTTVSVSRVALQFRTHINAQTDSNSTIPLYTGASTAMTVTSAVGQDSTTLGQSRSGSATAPWPEEIVVYLDLARCGPNGSASSTFFYPQGVGIPLDNLFGRDVRLDNISVRARIIGGPSVVDFTATLIGLGI